jgi:hypothetical protein
VLPAGGTEYYTTYQLPDREMPLYTYLDYAMNGYGGGGMGGNAVVFTAIGKRMSVFTEATLKWRNLADKRLYGNTDLAKLETPWPGATTGDLLARMEQDVSLAGNSFTRDCGDGVERLRPDWVTIVSAVMLDALGQQVRRVIGYHYDPVGDPEREDAFYPVDEVAHWAPVPDPLANFRGMSWLTPVVREIVGDVRMAEYREAYFRNAATPNLLIKYDTKLAPERITRLTTRLRERHTGPDGAFSTLVLDEGADATVIGQDMVGSAFDALQAAGETRILMAAGVQSVVAGAREGLQASAIGEYQQAIRAFVDFTIRPNWRGACAALQKLVPVPAAAQLWYDTTDVSALQQGEQDRAATSFQQVQAINALVMQGFTAESAVAAVVAGDMTLLVHTGLTSVQLQAPGQQSDQAPGQSPADAARNIVEMIQKVYLGVGTVITEQEARRLLNQAGAGLDIPAGPAPSTPPALPPAPADDTTPDPAGG